MFHLEDLYKYISEETASPGLFIFWINFCSNMFKSYKKNIIVQLYGFYIKSL